MSSSADTQPISETHISLPKQYNVVFHNDNKTTFEFVTSLLMEVFGHSETEAVLLTLRVHENNFAVVGTYLKEIAEAKVSQSLRAAASFNYPLVVTSEPS